MADHDCTAGPSEAIDAHPDGEDGIYCAVRHDDYGVGISSLVPGGEIRKESLCPYTGQSDSLTFLKLTMTASGFFQIRGQVLSSSSTNLLARARREEGQGLGDAPQVMRRLLRRQVRGRRPNVDLKVRTVPAGAHTAAALPDWIRCFAAESPTRASSWSR